MFTYTFVDNIYERHTHFIVASREEYQQYLRERGMETEISGTFGEAYFYDRPHPRFPHIMSKQFFIWMVQFDEKEAWDIGTLAHECWHITEDIMEHLGVKYFPDEDNEAFAHYCDALVRNFLTAWREHVKQSGGEDAEKTRQESTVST